MKKQNVVIIAVVAVILAVAVGYAIFQETLTVSGSATAAGDFNIDFTKVGTITKVGYTDVDSVGDAGIAKIEDGGNKLTVKVNKLDYPSAYVEIPVTITNNGSITAKLKNIVESGIEEPESSTINVTYSGVATTDDPIAQGETQNMTIRVEWNPEVNSGASDVEFSIQLEYEQATE